MRRNKSPIRCRKCKAPEDDSGALVLFVRPAPFIPAEAGIQPLRYEYLVSGSPLPRGRTEIVAAYVSALLRRLVEVLLQIFRVRRRLVFLDRHHIALAVEQIELVANGDPAIVLGAVVFLVDRIGDAPIEP